MKELAIDLEGFGDLPKKMAHTSQPPLVDKHGKLYDLDDPEFPVVKDHEFKVKYWAMPKTAPFMLNYIREHWAYFNKTRFGGRMKPPTFGLLKDVDAKKMKLRGRFTYWDRILELSPNLFNAPHEGWINRILIHEMCHQAVWDLEGRDAAIADGAKTKGHGPLWKGWMHKAGLPPSRFDDQGNEMYFDKFEKRKHKDYVEHVDTLKETREKYSLLSNPAFGDLIMYVKYNGPRVLGCVVCKSQVKPGWYVVAVSPGTRKFIRVAQSNIFYPFSSDIEGVNINPWLEDARDILEHASKYKL